MITWFFTYTQNYGYLPCAYKFWYRAVCSGTDGAYLNTMNVAKDNVTRVFTTSRSCHDGGFIYNDVVDVITIGF